MSPPTLASVSTALLQACVSVVAPFAILVAVAAIANLPCSCRRDRAKHDTARLDLITIRGALEQYALKTGALPLREPLAALVEANVLEAVPLDPWGRPYLILANGSGVDLISFGRDGALGGEEQSGGRSFPCRDVDAHSF